MMVGSNRAVTLAGDRAYGRPQMPSGGVTSRLAAGPRRSSRPCSAKWSWKPSCRNGRPRTGRSGLGLCVKGVAAHPGVFEMTWDNDSRATFSCEEERVPGQLHVIWRRVGTHAIFTPPPGPRDTSAPSS